MWSIGVMTYILLSGESPFLSFDDLLSGTFSFRGIIWYEISNEAKNFILKLITSSPYERMTAEEAFNHPFIVGQREFPELKNVMNQLCLYNVERKKIHDPLRVIIPKKVEKKKHVLTGPRQDVDENNPYVFPTIVVEKENETQAPSSTSNEGDNKKT